MPTKRFTTVTPLPPLVSRQIVLDTLRDHLEMIDLNPTHSTRNRIPPPLNASPEELNCSWYQITDRITMCPGFPQKSVTFNACFHNLADGSQIHCYAPMGLDIKQKWSVGGNMPGEPVLPTEIGIGAPITGLYIREDVELKCNILAARFVRRTLRNALEVLVARLLVKTQLIEAAQNNQKLDYDYRHGHLSPAVSNFSPYPKYQSSPSPRLPLSPPLSPPFSAAFNSSEMAGTFPSHEITSPHLLAATNNENKHDHSHMNYDWTKNTHTQDIMMPVELPS